MAKKISQLTQATEVKSDDVTVIVQDGETKKLPLNMMVTKQDIENKKVAGLAKLDEIETTYENDTYTPTITVKNKSSVKTGEGDGVDYSANVMDGHAKSAILKGSTKYRDIDTGEVLDAFEDGRNLELVSVKVPVLTTTGKNLFDAEADILTYGAINYVQNAQYLILNNDNTRVTLKQNNLIKVKPNSTLTLSCDSRFKVVIQEYDENDIRTMASDKGWQTNGYHTLTVGANTKKVNIYFAKQGSNSNTNITSEEFKILKNSIQFEENSTATSYEPYKSNILSTPEDLELRGIGDVRDTLDCLTGEVVERVSEVIFDGSDDEEWSRVSVAPWTTGNYIAFERNLQSSGIPGWNINGKYTLNDKFKDITYDEGRNNGEGLFVYDSGGKKICVRQTTIKTLEDWKLYLQQNPITVQYQLATESIKTVDLIPSGTHPSTTPYCWKNGHIQLSSSGLLPNLEYSVVTSRAGQINQNATMIVKNDKRIFDLEILLAGGLVNTTYQALTLQNQVETGLSKVSLSSETEPDYLLYHMIMKLIEEKAYKLDDLTEKVSVFYLYEKLSDEQFETIYSALYPFVEDEIVEEPVVEELPEVVEDEVIM